MLGRRARRETEEPGTQRTAGAERGSGLCGDHGIGKRRAGAGRGGDGRRAARLTSAILIPRRAAEQRRISVRSKAATPERSRKPLPAREAGDRSGSAQWGLVATPAPIFVCDRASRHTADSHPQSIVMPGLSRHPPGGQRLAAEWTPEQVRGDGSDQGLLSPSCPAWPGIHREASASRPSGPQNKSGMTTH